MKPIIFNRHPFALLPVFFGIALILSSLCYPITLYAKNARLAELEFKEAELIDAIRIISELSGHNISATPEAAKTKVTVFLRNITINEAIKTICRINNLWYRRDPKTRSYRIMTNEEYSQDLVIHRNDQSRVFTVRQPNIDLVADAIANLYGSRVERTSSGEGEDDSDDNGDSDNDSDENSNDNDDRLTSPLSVDQISSLTTRGNGNNLISARQLQQLTTQKEPIYVTVIAEHNLVVVRTGDVEALASIARLIKELDRPIPQVLLEMKILDVTIGDDFKSVFNFEVSQSRLSGDSTNPILLGNNALTGGGLVFEFLNDKLKSNIEFLEEKQRVRVLSKPIILAANNRPAKLFVGEEMVMVTGYEQVEVSATGTNITVSNNNIIPSTTIKEIGSTIKITPYINSDKTITLDIDQENSTLKNKSTTISVVSGGNVLSLPLDTITSSTLQGVIIAKDGYTIAVGGLVRETKSRKKSQVPWFSKIPGLGLLFTSKEDLDQRSELILMITPHVMVDPGSSPEINDRLTERANTTSLIAPPLIPQAKTDVTSLDTLSLRCHSLCQF